MKTTEPIREPAAAAAVLRKAIPRRIWWSPWTPSSGPSASRSSWRWVALANLVLTAAMAVMNSILLDRPKGK